MLYVNFAQGFVLPPYWLNGSIKQYSKKSQPESGVFYQCPLSLKRKSDSGDYWKLPFDPVISVSGGNKITRSDVLKQDSSNNQRRGTIKEVWSQDDYTVQIAGMFIGDTDDALPRTDLEKLRGLCEAREVVAVQCDLLDVFGIKYIAIEKYDFAHTAGMQNQQFAITAYSDDDFSLFVK